MSLQNSFWDNPRLSHGVLMEHMSNSGTASRAGVHCRCSSSDLVNRIHGFLLSGSSIGLMHINKLHLSSISEEALTVIPNVGFAWRQVCTLLLPVALGFHSALLGQRGAVVFVTGFLSSVLGGKLYIKRSIFSIL